jgi:hypothetical protein
VPVVIIANLLLVVFVVGFLVAVAYMCGWNDSDDDWPPWAAA